MVKEVSLWAVKVCTEHDIGGPADNRRHHFLNRDENASRSIILLAFGTPGTRATRIQQPYRVAPITPPALCGQMMSPEDSRHGEQESEEG